MIISKLFLISLLNLTSCLPFENSEVIESFNTIADIPTFCFERVNEDVFLSAKKACINKLFKDTLSIKKQNGQLKLPLSSGVNIYKTFRDSIKGTEDESRKEFKYLGQFKEIDFYVLSVTYWEHFEVYLVDKKSGNHYSVWSVPSLSPDNKKIATILSFGLEGEPAGVQILSVDKTSYTQVEKLIEVDQKLWNPVDFVWESNNSLILKVTDLDESKKDQIFSFLRLRLAK